jgi:NADH:ubiquinone reductase (H+-translocating)
MTEDLKNTIQIPDTVKNRVVIIGGGFAGIEFVRHLPEGFFQVVMFDRHNYHTFQPLLYQVATAGLEPDSIAEPLRKVFEGFKEFYFRLAEVNEIQLQKNKVITSIGELTYDYLIVANGSRTNYFGNQEIYKKAFPLKQIPQALDLRSNILQCMEKAVIVRDPAEKQRLLNFVIVGGGPTGVEVAGALGELKLHILPNDYPELDMSMMKVYLIEGSGRLLAAMSEKSSQKALEYTRKFGVTVILDTVVKSFDGRKAVLSNGEEIPTETLVWAAGVMGNVIPGFQAENIGRGNRLLVNEYNQVNGTENVFALGDIALMSTADNPNGHPMLAPVAQQQGRLLASNLYRLTTGSTMKAFVYNDKGSMATVGRNKAVVDLPGFTFHGFLAWAVWMFVHLFSIAGFRNKVVIFSNWVYHYITFDRGNRLIIRPFIKPYTLDQTQET